MKTTAYLVALVLTVGCSTDAKVEDTAGETTPSATTSGSTSTTGTTTTGTGTTATTNTGTTTTGTGTTTTGTGSTTSGTTTGTTATTGTGTTATTGTGTTTTAGTDTTDPAVTEFEARLSELLTDAGLPGAQAALIKDGETVWTWNYGFANEEEETPVTTDTSFPLASVSKTVTGTALMQVYETGAFELDDPIASHLSFEVNHPESRAAITFRQLLTHTSGIRDNWSVMPYVPGDPTEPLGEYLENYLDPDGDLYDASSNFTSWGPGDDYMYSNIGIALSGYLVESITGTDFAEWCRERIFTPLNMEHTGWYLADLEDALVAHPHDCYYGPCETLGHYGYADYPDGLLRSSASDMARFLAMFERGGSLDGHLILQERSVNEMLSLQLPSRGQGLIWYESRQEGDLFWGHGGNDIGVATSMKLRQRDGVGYILWMNADPNNWTRVDDATRAMLQAADTLF